MIDEINKTGDIKRKTNLYNPYFTNVIQSIEIFLKILLKNEGKNIPKSHKILNLYEMLEVKTQQYLLEEFNKYPHMYNLKDVLFTVNYNFVRYRYNDLNTSSSLIFKGADELLLFAKILYAKQNLKRT